MLRVLQPPQLFTPPPIRHISAETKKKLSWYCCHAVTCIPVVFLVILLFLSPFCGVRVVGSQNRHYLVSRQRSRALSDLIHIDRSKFHYAKQTVSRNDSSGRNDARVGVRRGGGGNGDGGGDGNGMAVLTTTAIQRIER